jgi:hypothetical protein
MVLFSEGLISGFYITVFGFLGAVLAVCYKSKCRKIACCGIVIDRDVEGEEKIDTLEMVNRKFTPVVSDTIPDKSNNEQLDHHIL